MSNEVLLDDTVTESSSKGAYDAHKLFNCSEGLSVPDDIYGFMVSKGCCPQSLCDPKLSEEDKLSPMGSEDCCPRILCDPKLLEEDTQEDMQIYNPDPSDILLPGKPLSLIIQDGIPSKTPLV